MVKLTEALVLARSRASDLENVRKLNCWGSELTDVSILRLMPNVQIVSLSVNKIKTLAHFAPCTNLEELYIRRNEIGSLSEVLHLRHLPKLRVLWLADNPCADQEKYRNTVLKALPNLQKLDNINVQEDDINTALEDGLELVPPPGGASSSSPKLLPRLQEESAPVRAQASGESPKPSISTPPIVSASVDVGEMERQRERLMRLGDFGSPGDSGDPVTLSWEETNKIRQQLGLKPLSVEKVTPMKPRTHHTARARNANILQAALHLIKELDAESLEIVADAVRNRLESL